MPVKIVRAHTIFENLGAHFTVASVAPRIAALTVTINLLLRGERLHTKPSSFALSLRGVLQ
jgi:hypothetical protein